MITDHPFTDLQEAYRNRARIEKMRKTESVLLKVKLPESDYAHWPLRVKPPIKKYRRRM